VLFANRPSKINNHLISNQFIYFNYIDCNNFAGFLHKQAIVLGSSGTASVHHIRDAPFPNKKICMLFHIQSKNNIVTT
jgi:hypothetical protein